jgi:CRP-like cAMP-binding protein
MAQRSTAEILRHIPFFTDLPDEELERLQLELEEVHLKPGEILYREGEAGEDLYIVVSGELEILMSPGGENELVLNIVREGEYIGEMSLLQPEGRRTTSARARDEVTLLSMNRAQFRELLRQYPELSRTTISVLSQRLVNTNVQTVRMLTDKNRQLQNAYNELSSQFQANTNFQTVQRLDVTTSFRLTRIPDTVQTDATLTATYLEKTVAPYLKATTDLQHVLDSVKGRPFREIRIYKISQNSPIEAVLGNAVDAVTSAKEDIIPWRRKHAQQMAHLIEQEKTVAIERERTEILSSRATAAKDRAEEKKIQAEIEKVKAETERMELENEKVRWEMQQSKIQLGLDILLKINSTLSETQRIAFLLKLLEPLNILTSSELEIIISE